MSDESENTQKTEEKDPFNTEQLDYLSRMVNAAVSHRLNTFQTKMEGTLGDLSSKLDGLAKPPETSAEAESGANGKVTKTQEIEILNAKLEQRTKEYEEKLRALAEEQKQRDAEIARNEEFSTLKDALVAQGVSPTMIRGAMAYVQDAIARDDEGQIRYRYPESFGGIESESLIAVEDGVKKWLDTEEGKHFLPPVNAAGSANPGGQAPSVRGQKTNGQLIQDLFNSMGG